MDLMPLCDKFDRELEDIEVSASGILERSTMAIHLCRDFLQSLKLNVQKNKFNNKIEEINFFKNIKQTPLIPLIYYSEIRSFEIQFPKGNIECQRKYVKKKINKLNRFFICHLDFGQYIDLNHTHFDVQYYTRDFLDTYPIYSSKFYFQDPDFSTSRDMLLGKYKAYTKLITYLNNRLYSLTSSPVATEPSIEKLIWPFTNTDWVELVYALSTAGIAQKNNLSIKKISRRMGDIFDFTPKDIYKTYKNIKNRKNSKTIFLDMLNSSLLSEIYRSEE